MQTKGEKNQNNEDNENITVNKVDEIVGIALKGVGMAMAMGIAVTVLTVLGEIDTKSAFTMLGIGLTSVSIY